VLTDDELRRSFEVVPVSDLPSTDGLELVPSDRDACCAHCEADWPQVADVAVAWLESGGDPLDLAGLDRRARDAQLGADELDALWSLFADPITWFRGRDRYVNGRHRVHALRAAGVERCVVYTGRGEPGHELALAHELAHDQGPLDEGPANRGVVTALSRRRHGFESRMRLSEDRPDVHARRR